MHSETPDYDDPNYDAELDHQDCELNECEWRMNKAREWADYSRHED